MTRCASRCGSNEPRSTFHLGQFFQIVAPELRAAEELGLQDTVLVRAPSPSPC